MSEEKPVEKELPRVGDDVYFYGPGNSQVPVWGKVLHVWGPDVVTLAVWEVNRLVDKGSVSRRGCDAVVNSPQIEQRFGVWDYKDPPEIRQAMRDLVNMAIRTEKKASKTA